MQIIYQLYNKDITIKVDYILYNKVKNNTFNRKSSNQLLVYI